MSSLENVKLLLDISEGDNTKDSLISLYINRAENFVKADCNQEELNPSLRDAVEEIAVIFYQNREFEGIKSTREGDMTTSFLNTLPSHVISILNSNRRLKFI